MMATLERERRDWSVSVALGSLVRHDHGLTEAEARREAERAINQGGKGTAFPTPPDPRRKSYR